MSLEHKYGTPVSIDLSVPCDDSLDIEYQIVCGDVDGKVKLLPENSTCAKFFSLVVEEENNYILEADVDNLSEYKVFPFQLKVIDKKKPAYAKIRVITRSGNWIEKEFNYEGLDLGFNPTEVKFGVHPIGQKVCTTVVVVNKDPEAPIFDLADFGVVGDLHSVVPDLTSRVQARK